MMADGVERGEIELLIHWQFNVKVLEEIRKKEEKYNKSAIGQLKKGASVFKGQLSKLTGKETEDSDDDDIDEVNLYVCLLFHC
jgi:hypothetical protein